MAQMNDWNMVTLTAPQRVVDIIGGYNIDGYFESAFATAYRGVPGKFTIIFIDEADNMAPDCQMLFSLATSERKLALPTGEIIEMGDVAIVCAMNTCGNGPTPHFPTAIPWGAAMKDRFCFIKVEPDANINLAVSGEQALAEFATGVQKAADRLGMFRTTMSARGIGIFKDSILLDGESMGEAFDEAIAKGASKATMLTLLGGVKEEVSSRNKYLREFESWINSMAEPARGVRL